MIIESLGVHLPARAASTAEVVAPCVGVSAAALERLTGIRSRPVAGTGEHSIDLARAAVRECFRHSGLAPGAIDLLICCNISRCDGPGGRISLEPTTALRLKADFGLENAFTFDISNACAGVFTGLLLAETFLQAAGVRRALIVSGEYTTHLLHTAQREIRGLSDPRLACLTLGDSGVALTVERSERPDVGWGAIDLFTVGRFSELCLGKLTDRAPGGAIMLTDSRSLTRAAIERSVPHMIQTLEGCRWDLRDIAVFIMHQTAKKALDMCRNALNASWHTPWLHDGNCVYNVERRGNLASNSHFVAVHDQIQAGRLRSGDRAAFLIAASGLTAGSALYTFDDLPDRLRGGSAPAPGSAVATGIAPGGDGAIVEEGDLIRIESAGLALAGPGLGRTVLELAQNAAESCLERSGYTREEIELIIYTGVYRDALLSEPAMAALLAGALRINHDVRAPYERKTLALDLSSGAVGFLKACLVAARMIRSGRFRNALILTAENQHYAAAAGDHSRPIAAAGSAAILDRDPHQRSGFSRFRFDSYPEHLDRRSAGSDWIAGRPVLITWEDPEFDDISLRCLIDSLRGERRHGLLSHPRSTRFLSPRLTASRTDALADLCGLKVVRDLENCPEDDLYTSFFLHSWHSSMQSGRVVPGEVGLFAQVGAGIEVGLAYYQF
jgi:3-oxoacyl-[acyl-carrier-protein] synthase III